MKIIIEVLRSVVPYRSLDYFWRYFRYVESINSGHRQLDISLILLIFIYYNLNFFYNFFTPNQSTFHRFFHGDIVHLFYNQYFTIVPITIDVLNAYFIYIMYIRVDIHVATVTKTILKSSAALRRLCYIQVNILMIFVIIADSTIIYWHVGYFWIAWEQHYDSLFNAGLLGWFRLLVHFCNSLAQDVGLITYAHICILMTMLGLPAMIFIKQSFRLNLLKLGTSGPVWTAQLKSFIRADLKTFNLIFVLDRVYGRLFWAFMLVSCPTNAFLTIVTILGHFTGPISMLTIFGIASHQVMCVFALHLYMASIVKLAHSSAKVLLSLAARKQHKVGNFRTKLSLEAAIGRLHTKKKYGFTYGSLALINMDTFFKFLLLYGKFLIFSYKIIQRNNHSL